MFGAERTAGAMVLWSVGDGKNNTRGSSREAMGQSARSVLVHVGCCNTVPQNE